MVLKVALLAFWIGTFLSGVHILEAPTDENVFTPVRSGVLRYNSFSSKSVKDMLKAALVALWIGRPSQACAGQPLQHQGSHACCRSAHMDATSSTECNARPCAACGAMRAWSKP